MMLHLPLQALQPATIFYFLDQDQKLAAGGNAYNAIVSLPRAKTIKRRIAMLKTLAVANYRSINKLVIPLGRLNLITGPNGSGKSNLYRALRLLAETAQGGVVNALAREGGLDLTFWAGPETISRRMRNGEVAIEPTVRQGVKRLRLGFATEVQIAGYCNPDVIARPLAGRPPMLTTYLLRMDAEPSEQLSRFIDRVNPPDG